MTLEEQIASAESYVRILKQKLFEQKKAQAPRCERCQKSLWDDRYGCACFIGITMKDSSNHRMCDACANEFLAEHQGDIEGAWDVPDPMGM